MTDSNDVEISRQIENVLRSNFGPLDPRDDFELVARIAVYTRQNGDYTSLRRDILAPPDASASASPNNFCTLSSVFDVAGKARTDSDGTVTMLLSDFLCGDNRPRAFDAPAVIIATPRAKAPLSITARAQVTADKKDVQIEVETWTTAGVPAANQSFDWNCRVTLPLIVD